MKCTFKVKNKTEFDDGLANVHMEPVQTEVNKEFFQSVPYGTFDLMGITPEAAKLFTVGKECVFDITPVV